MSPLRPLSPRESGALISSRSRHVSVDANAAVKCAEFLLGRIAEGRIALKDLFQSTDVHPKSADEKGAEWLFFADTLNFSFWNPDDEPQYEVTFKGTKYNGYLSLCAAINRTLSSGVNITDPTTYGRLTEEELGRYLVGDNGVPCPMIPKRLRCLKGVAKVLQEKYDGSVTKLINSGEKSAEKLLDIIVNDFECFRDCATLSDGTRVSFYKRAQIFISDLWSLFKGEGLGQFHDLDKLTMFADYRVPQSLQYFGVLTYSEELLEKLRRGDLLENGSELEVEIRGCSIHAVNLITDAAKKSKPDIAVNDVLVDYFLWGFRREKAQEMADKFPYHKTRSIFY